MDTKEVEAAIRAGIARWNGDYPFTLGYHIWNKYSVRCEAVGVYTCRGCDRIGTAMGQCKVCGARIDPGATHVMVTVPALDLEVVERIGK